LKLAQALDDAIDAVGLVAFLAQAAPNLGLGARAGGQVVEGGVEAALIEDGGVDVVRSRSLFRRQGRDSSLRSERQ